VRVVLETGEQLGIMSVDEALSKAKKVGLDLVEIAATVNPPVCRICDYGKYRYEQAKLKKKNARPTTKLKEVKFRVGTEENDYRLKCTNIEKFVKAGNKVRVQLQFKGRENAHREFGFNVLNRVAEDVKGCTNLDQVPKLAGKAVAMTLSPLSLNQQTYKFLAVGDISEPEEDLDGDQDLDTDIDIDNEDSEEDSE
jgi:translation initiation factor IF-3